MENFAHLSLLGFHSFDLDVIPSEDELVEVWPEIEDFEVVHILDESLIVEETISEVETIPGSPHFIEQGDTISEVETIPGSPHFIEEGDTIPVLEIVDSDSEVELVEPPQVVQVLTMQEELERMRAEERHGHYIRVELRQLAVEERLSSVFQAIASETVEQRRARRLSFRVQVHGSGGF